MEREISISTELAVILVGVAAVLGLVSFLLFVGKDIQYGASEKMVDIKDSVGYDYVVSLANGEMDNEMPSVTAYNILTKYGDIVTWSANLTVKASTVENTHACRTARAEGYDDADYLCSGIRNLQIHGSDIAENMKGRVQLELIPTNSDTFVAIVHPERSTWKSGVVDSSCENVEWYNKLMVEQGLDMTWRAENLNGCTP